MSKFVKRCKKIQEAEKIPESINPNKSTKHIKIKFLKTMDKRKYLDKCRENCHFSYRVGNSNDNRFLMRNHRVQKGVAHFSVAGKKKKKTLPT